MKFQHTITNLPAENEYPKLIRDNIPQIIADNDSRKADTRVLSDDEEFLAFLFKKVLEEAEELVKSTTDLNLVEEIADVYEVIDTILKLKGVTPEEVLGVQEEKRMKRGGFEERLVMLHND
jgi:predicted house-cleaning noncanonical NTP pyrophosphatase (MazG superfamily)